MTFRLLDLNWAPALDRVQSELRQMENGHMTETFPDRWNFTSVLRDGQRKRVVEGHVAWIQICAWALREAMKAGAALEIERIR